MVLSTGDVMTPWYESTTVSPGALPVLALGLPLAIPHVVIHAELSPLDLMTSQELLRHLLHFGLPLLGISEVPVEALSVVEVSSPLCISRVCIAVAGPLCTKVVVAFVS